MGDDPEEGFAADVAEVEGADGDGHLALIWAAAPGDAFRVEYSDVLDPADWQPLGVATAATESVSIADTNDWPQAQRFYRAVALP